MVVARGVGEAFRAQGSAAVSAREPAGNLTEREQPRYKGVHQHVLPSGVHDHAISAFIFSVLRTAFAAADSASAHFAIPGVKHTEDEELSLFRRLRERGGAAGREVLAAVEDMESEHRAAERLHAELDGFLAVMPRDGSADASDVDRFSEIVARLCAVYRPHLQVENDLIFPFAAWVLSDQALERLAAEMYARRRVLVRRLGSR